MTVTTVDTNHQVGIRELKNNLSAYLKQVKASTTLTITDHGEPIGQLVPMQKSVETRLQELTAAGLLAWNVQPYRPNSNQLPPGLSVDALKSATEVLLEERS